MSTEYRHEYKYRMDAAQAALLEAKAKAILKRDANAGENGAYVIKSLYFDNHEDECFYENEDGYNHRSKFRIRYYNDNTKFIRLEKKSKCNGMTKKESCRITKEQCEVFLSGKIPKIEEEMSSTMKRLFLEMKMRNMMPKVIVQYERIPFVCMIGNVRITFDRALMSSNDIGSFLSGIKTLRPVFRKGESLLEVKWDELLPDYMKEQMTLGSLQWTSFSKYYLCRKYNCYGGVRI